VLRIIGAVASIVALVLLAVAVRALFVGYNSFDPVLVAGLYVWLFAFVAFSMVLIYTVRRIGGDRLHVLFALALVGAIGLAQLAPTIGEPNYCWFFGDYPDIAARWRPPQTFRCTSLPFEIFGWFAGWGVGFWLMNRRASRSSVH
jgi:hypothetical protein